MNKEPIGLYIFRFILALGLFAFMAMLYWSSVLLEKDVKILRHDVTQVKNELSAWRRESQKQQRELLKSQKSSSIESIEKISPNQDSTNSDLSASRPQIDPSLPNLLNEDVFYTTTLPKMLGPDFQPTSIRQGATIGKPDSLHPFSNWSQVANWISMCTGAVGTNEFGKYETLAPDLAIKMEERKMKNSEGVPEFWVHLRDQVYWQPLSPTFFSSNITLAPHFQKKHQVTAHDFKFYFDALMNPAVQQSGAAALRNFLGDIQEIEVIDDLTFVVRWKTEMVKETDGKEVPKIKYIAKLMTAALRPLPSFVYQYFSDGKKIVEDDSDPETYRTNSVWAQNFSNHWARNIIVCCGPWNFEGMTDRYIRFSRNPDHYNPYAVLVEGMEITFRNSTESVWQDFKEGKLDTHTVQPDGLIELENFLRSPHYLEQEANGLAIRKLEYLDHSYTYIGWNEARPFFSSPNVRRALTMAIDRKRIIQQNLNGMGVEIHGTFFPTSPNQDPNISPLPFDPIAAKRLLEEEGWYDFDGDGYLDKVIHGKSVIFRFSLTYFVKNPITKSICEYVATALKEIGIDCQLHGVDVADLSAIFDDKNFDALCLAWALGTPPEEPKQLWHSSGKEEKGSSNVIGFANKQVDQIIYELQFEHNKEKRRELYRQFDAIIHQEQPYTFLYSPKVLFLYREYLQNVFIPAKRQDLIPGADIEEPEPSIFWIKKQNR